jgi:hypothetical protein
MTEEEPHYLKAAEKLRRMLETNADFGVSLYGSINPNEAVDRRYGVKIFPMAPGQIVDCIDVYPNLDEDGLLVGFTHTGSLKGITPEPIMQMFGKLVAQIELEKELLEGMKRVMEGNDYTNWQSVPMPPLGRIRKLD